MAAAESARNVAIVGPNGTGKTTLLESLLFVTGAIGRKGKAGGGEGHTVGDSLARGARAPDEHRGQRRDRSSTRASSSTFLDCPGAVDFAQEARNALLGVDAAVVVVEPVLERMITVSPLLKYLDAHQIPHLIFINKMDRSEVPYRDLLQSLRDLSDRPVVPHQYAIGRSRHPGRLHRPRDRAGLQLQRRRALGSDRPAARSIASASRRRAPRCSRRSPTSTTT